MSEIKHTPGPWRIAVDSWGRTEIESDNPRDNAETDQVLVLASSIGGRIHGENFDDYSEVEANVKLIAAAPELLEALTQLKTQVENRCGEEAMTHYPAVALARAVIASATE